MAQSLEFRLLGPIEVRKAGSALPLARGKERALLAILLLNRNEVVPIDRLLEDLWSGSPPATAQTALHGYVGKLRKLIGDRLETRDPGYVLRVEPDELDTDRFEHLLVEGRVHDALALWRGRPLLDVETEPFARAEIGRLRELRLVALERDLEARVENGRAAEAVPELEALVREEPFRERLRALLMLALYRAGRQADALAAYRELRRLFDEELGIEPSQEVRQLEQRILAQDPALAPSARTPASPVAEPPRQERRIVTVVRCELAGPAEIDPERMGSSLERLFDSGTETIERHGGAVVAISGEALVGAFGLQRSREDDALRALQAAVLLAELPAVRVGVATGEVLVGGRLPVPVGEAMTNSAALGSSSPAGAVLLDPATYLRCRDVLVVESVAPDAYRLLSPPSAAKPLARRLDVPLVGRERELADLGDAIDRAADRRAPSVVTVLGAPGVGKTRLAREFSADVADRARVLTGHCVPHGLGGPLQEIAAALADDSRVESGSFEAGRTQPEKIRAFRLLVRALTAELPLVLVVEDAHWADESFLELLEHVVDFDADLPLLVLVLARPEFAEEHADWLGRRQNARTLRLGSLSPPEARAHVDHLGQDATVELRAQVVAAAEGNPLFAEQLLSHALERGGVVQAPPSLEALLAARVDGLELAERAVLGAAAVIGEEFSLGELVELAPGRLDLAAFVRRDLVRPEGDDTFRFAHALVRDAAYGGLLKQTRAELHEAYADVLARDGAGREAVIGYHLEAAHRALTEAGRDAAHAAELARRAAAALGAAGWSARLRGDAAGAGTLAERALALLGPEDPLRPDLLVLLGRARTGIRLHGEADELFREAAELARVVGDDATERLAELYRLQMRFTIETEIGSETIERVGTEAHRSAEALERAGDDRCAHVAWLVVHSARYLTGDYGGGLEALDHAIAAGRRAEAIEVRVISRPMLLHLYGPTPSSEALAYAQQLLDDDIGLAATADALAYGGVLHAMQGDPTLGREWVMRSQALWHEAGADVFGWFGEQAAVDVLAGDWPAAEATLRRQCELLDSEDQAAVWATYAVALGQALLQLGKDEEAEAVALEAKRRAAGFDAPVQALWRAVRACALARRGEHDEAAAVADEAVALAFRTDDLWCRGDVHLRVSEVHERAGRIDDAIAAARVALESYEAKEHLVGVSWARSALDTLSPSSA